MGRLVTAFVNSLSRTLNAAPAAPPTAPLDERSQHRETHPHVTCRAAESRGRRRRGRAGHRRAARAPPLPRGRRPAAGQQQRALRLAERHRQRRRYGVRADHPHLRDRPHHRGRHHLHARRHVQLLLHRHHRAGQQRQFRRTQGAVRLPGRDPGAQLLRDGRGRQQPRPRAQRQLLAPLRPHRAARRRQRHLRRRQQQHRRAHGDRLQPRQRAADLPDGLQHPAEPVAREQPRPQLGVARQLRLGRRERRRLRRETHRGTGQRLPLRRVPQQHRRRLGPLHQERHRTDRRRDHRELAVLRQRHALRRHRELRRRPQRLQAGRREDRRQPRRPQQHRLPQRPRRVHVQQQPRRHDRHRQRQHRQQRTQLPLGDRQLHLPQRHLLPLRRQRLQRQGRRLHGHHRPVLVRLQRVPLLVLRRRARLVLRLRRRPERHLRRHPRHRRQHHRRLDGRHHAPDHAPHDPADQPADHPAHDAAHRRAAVHRRLRGRQRQRLDPQRRFLGGPLHRIARPDPVRRRRQRGLPGRILLVRPEHPGHGDPDPLRGLGRIRGGPRPRAGRLELLRPGAARREQGRDPPGLWRHQQGARQRLLHRGHGRAVHGAPLGPGQQPDRLRQRPVRRQRRRLHLRQRTDRPRHLRRHRRLRQRRGDQFVTTH
ncbi:exported hypothetical protein [Actinacidiphila bryophytorum]|uniref:Uncharacterized protein n=1 Tax=Actinacidiphila bryophytorum TaxID=1436133 RepID=A0A9W4GWN8_9ACTN|nr:exported hypothetical protein [Actinacidiphila bryophytorum]